MIQSSDRTKGLPRLTVPFFRESTARNRSETGKGTAECGNARDRRGHQDGAVPLADWDAGPRSHRWRGEVRTRLSTRLARVLFTLDRNVMVLLHGFIKKGRETPGSDLELAKQRLKEAQECRMMTKTARKANPHIGSDIDDFLREEGVYDQAEAVAVKRVLAFELERNMKKAQLTKTHMAKRMGTTRAQLDRLLNPENPATTLQTLVKAAGAIGKRVKISLVNA